MYHILRISMVVAGIFAGLSAASNEAVANDRYSEEECYVQGLVSKLRCYSIERPISGNPGETVTLGGVIVPSDAVVPEPDPLVILAGGPGQAASDMASMMTHVLRVVNTTRDLIFFDIRGTGMSAPVSCDDTEDVPPLTHVEIGRITKHVAECHQNAGHLAGATTKQAAEDLDALRQVLGIEQLNLWGGSYGTRLAQYYMVAFGDHVRSAILDAVVPFEPSYVNAQANSSETALEQLVSACAEDRNCQSAFPDFDPIALLNQIETGRPISYVHPVTGLPVETVTSRAAAAQAVFVALYSPESRIHIPYALTQAVKNDNWAPLATLAVDAGAYMGLTTIYMGAYLSISCAEERAAINSAPTQESPFLQGYAKEAQQGMCEVWPAMTEELPNPKGGEIKTPVFMLSGGIDPITPESLAKAAEATFQNVRHYMLPNGGHINSHRRCIAEFLPDFIKTPDDQSLMPDCMGQGHVPAFIVSPSGPAVLGGIK